MTYGSSRNSANSLETFVVGMARSWSLRVSHIAMPHLKRKMYPSSKYASKKSNNVSYGRTCMQLPINLWA